MQQYSLTKIEAVLWLIAAQLSHGWMVILFNAVAVLLLLAAYYSLYNNHKKE